MAASRRSVAAMASRFAVLDIDVELDERAGKKKQDKTKLKNDENGKKAINKPNSKKKKTEGGNGPTVSFRLNCGLIP